MRYCEGVQRHSVFAQCEITLCVFSAGHVTFSHSNRSHDRLFISRNAQKSVHYLDKSTWKVHNPRCHYNYLRIVSVEKYTVLVGGFNISCNCFCFRE